MYLGFQSIDATVIGKSIEISDLLEQTFVRDDVVVITNFKDEEIIGHLNNCFNTHVIIDAELLKQVANFTEDLLKQDFILILMASNITSGCKLQTLNGIRTYISNNF